MGFMQDAKRLRKGERSWVDMKAFVSIEVNMLRDCWYRKKVIL